MKPQKNLPLSQGFSFFLCLNENGFILHLSVHLICDSVCVLAVEVTWWAKGTFVSRGLFPRHLPVHLSLNLSPNDLEETDCAGPLPAVIPPSCRLLAHPCVSLWISSDKVHSSPLNGV